MSSVGVGSRERQFSRRENVSIRSGSRPRGAVDGRVKQGADQIGPEPVTRAGGEGAEGSGRIIEGEKGSQEAFLKEAGASENREDAGAASTSGIQETRDLIGRDEGGGEEIGADEQDGKVGGF